MSISDNLTRPGVLCDDDNDETLEPNPQKMKTKKEWAIFNYKY